MKTDLKGQIGSPFLNIYFYSLQNKLIKTFLDIFFSIQNSIFEGFPGYQHNAHFS